VAFALRAGTIRYRVDYNFGAVPDDADLQVYGKRLPVLDVIDGNDVHTSC